ncbi:RNA-dependent RNA polymerase [Erysiphe necator associated levi-like virus 1]|nr:RNA-dependent RNA polymerase [Erysiphe necator associated levi-like virus 1]
MVSTYHIQEPDANRLLNRVVFETCKSIDSPRSLAVWMLFDSNEHTQLLGLDIDPNSYASAHEFSDDYLVTKFLSKYPGLKTGIDTRAVALDTFLSCERTCSITNTRLSRDPFGAFGPIIDSMRKIISSCLPVNEESPKLPLSEISASCGWGPGVTSSVKGQKTSRFHKLLGSLELTKNLYDVGGLSLTDASSAWKKFHSIPQPEASQAEASVTYRLTGGNTLAFVAKNAKTDRPIAVEPHLNAYLQKGIGTYIRRRLFSRFGLDLSDQSLNCEMARVGSRDNSLATLDLKSASDTISQEVVELLLPAEWVFLLGCCRSQKYKLDDKWIPYHKWSSMGNGYTFELETLIFYSAALACVNSLGLDSTQVRCYGDDVIVPTEAYQLLVSLLQHLGFSVNLEKSFHSGPFRESCGKDYFNGVDTRPFFIRESLTHVSSVYKLANAVMRYAGMRHAYGRDVRFRSIWISLFTAVRKDLRYRIPDGIGDGGFIGSFDESVPTRSRRRSVLYQRSWYRYPYLGFSPGEGRKDGPLAVISVLDTMDDQDQREPYGRRGSPVLSIPCSAVDGSTYQLRKAGKWRPAIGHTPDWPDLGGWI